MGKRKRPYLTSSEAVVSRRPEKKSFVRLTHADSRLCGHRPLAVPWKLMHGGVENWAAVRQLGAPKLGHQDGRI